ncbi:hypothetical protein [Azospirillum oleiclasticum]|nr:hypothetical protein [Azospirillum oleiclasticum]
MPATASGFDQQGSPPDSLAASSGDPRPAWASNAGQSRPSAA